MNSRRLLQRFLRYVKIDTTARADAKTYPSSPGRLEARTPIGPRAQGNGHRATRRQDEHGIVMATVPEALERSAFRRRCDFA